MLRVARIAAFEKPAAWARQILFGIGLAMLCGRPAPAQSALYVSDGQQEYRLVHAIGQQSPWILENGKLALPAPSDTASGNLTPRYKLEPVEEFSPAFVAATVERANFTHAGLESVHRLDQRFSFKARFASNFKLHHAFFALEFNTDDPERRIAVHEITPTDLREQTPISIDAPLGSTGTVDHYKLHVFSDGLEIFSSEMSRDQIVDALHRMVLKRTKGLQTSAPKPLTGPMPSYPSALLGAKPVGRAIISCVISIDGRPTDIQLKAASNPAVGNAALAVMSQWWFLPKIENGQAIASKAELPFDFAPPKS